MSEFDVIVLGAGLAGYSAALAAAETGAMVLLAEKCSRVGGSTILSNGMMAFANTPLQQKLGIKDSPSLLLHDLRAVGGPIPKMTCCGHMLRNRKSFMDGSLLSALNLRMLSLVQANLLSAVTAPTLVN